jgi:hypothetical protein
MLKQVKTNKHNPRHTIETDGYSAITYECTLCMAIRVALRAPYIYHVLNYN